MATASNSRVLRAIPLTAVLLAALTGFSKSHAQEVRNILANGGFEDGAVAPWDTYGGVSTEVVRDLVGAAVPEAPAEGDSCLHIVVPAAGENFWDAGLLHRDHVFEAGKKYTLSAFLKCRHGTLQINFKPELDQDPWTGYGEQSFTMTEEWAEYSTTTDIFTEDVSSANITFHIAYTAGDFWIDDVRFYEGDYVPAEFAKSELASNPDPVDGGMYYDTWARLTWKPGDTAASHDVYFGDDFEDVSDGTGGTFLANQRTTTLDVGSPGSPHPNGLVPGATYYWRIDEVEADGTTVHKGEVWSFLIRTFAPYTHPIEMKGVSYTAWQPTAMLSEDSNRSLAKAREDGCDWIALCVWWFQDNVSSTAIEPDYTRFSATPESVVHAINQCHEQGMKVMLKPMVDCP
jgi:hypothetical protein